jgi:hypothetical protein
MSLSSVPGLPSQVSPAGRSPEASTTSPTVKADQPQKGPQSQVELRSNSQRNGTTASTGTPTAMPPRKQALKAMAKHSWGALKHGAMGAGLAVERLAHHGTAALSRPESGMAREHEIAGILTKPLVDSEFGMARVHSHAVGRAFVDLVKKTRTYDPGLVAMQLAPMKEIKSSSQSLKDTTLGTPGKTNGLGEQKYELVFPEIAAPVKRPKIEVPAEAAAHQPHTAAAKGKGFASALRSTARGVGHKIMQGLHTTGAAVWSKQMSVSFTHRQAAAKHEDLAIGHFTNADFSIRLGRTYGVEFSIRWSRPDGAIAARQDLTKASHALDAAGPQADAAVPTWTQSTRKVALGSPSTPLDTPPRSKRIQSSPPGL